MAKTLRLEIVTPDAKTYSDDVDYVLVPGAEGDMGIFPEHVPLLSKLLPGELVVKKGDEVHRLAVGEGFVEITNKSVSVLTDMALNADDIDEDAVQEAIKSAKEAMKNESLSKEQSAAFQATIQKSLAQLHVKRRRRSI